MIRLRIDGQLNRLQRLFDNDPSNHDAIEDAMAKLTELATDHPDIYQEALEARGEFELIDSERSTVLHGAGLIEALRDVGATQPLAPNADTFAGLFHARKVRDRARGAARPPAEAMPQNLERGVWFPNTREALAVMLREAGRKNMRVSTAGSWRSVSDVNRPAVPPQAGDIILGTSFLNRALPTVGANTYTCETGRAVWQITEDLHDRNQAMVNMGGGDFQTLGGAVSTGTHGSGRNLGDLASFVEEVELCTLDANREPVFKQLSGPDLAAAGVALGALGVVYSARFKVQPTYHLRERRLLMPWTEAKKAIRRHLGGRDSWRHLEVLVIPYPVEMQPLRGKIYRHNMRRYTSHRSIPQRGILAVLTVRGIVPEGTTGGDAQRPLAMRIAKKGFGRWIAYQGLNSMLQNPRGIPDLLKSSMARQHVDDYVDNWNEVLKLGLTLDATGCELSVPIDEGIRAAEIILATAAGRRTGGTPRKSDRGEVRSMWRTRPMHTSPFALRFVKSSPAWLSMAEGRDSCMIEMPMLKNPRIEDLPQDNEQTALYRDYRAGRHLLYSEVYDTLATHIRGVRPHWGLEAPASAEGEPWARSTFPKWDNWMEVYRRMNLHGTFDSAFTDRMGISVRPR
ncbi:MAG: FAD-binding protein [Proteobacteria bacterium]|nr:FAD-binding protein [Pseudomonadota bacterium]